MKKQISSLTEEMKFLFLRDFAQWIDEGIDREWGKLQKRAESGEFEEYENYEAAMDYPLFRAKYAAHAVLHLLNVLVDEQLRNIVSVSTEYSYEPNKPTLPSEIISRLSFREIRKHIEDRYKISLIDIEGWDHYLKIRKIVNALKHSSGERRLREVSEEEGTWKDLRYEPKLEDVKESVDICRRLVRSLFRIVHCNEKRPNK